MRRRKIASEDPESPKKLRERRVIDCLRSVEPRLAAGEIRFGRAGEEPDFVCHSNDSLGVEIVECFRSDKVEGSPLKEQEFLADLVTQTATSECKRVGLTNFIAHVEFDFCERIRKEDVHPLAEQLISLVKPVALGQLRKLRLMHKRELPKGVGDLWVCRREHMRNPFVGRQWGGTVKPVDEVGLRRLIREKERKLRIYRQRCSEVWLTILLDPFRISSMAYVPPDFRLATSAFDRIIALQGWSYTTELWKASA